MLAWACTCHKVQGLSLPSAVISFELFKQKQFNAGQMYVALSRLTRIEGLHLIGEYKENAIHVTAKAEIEYKRLHSHKPFTAIKQLNNSPQSVTICLINIRLLHKHTKDLASDKRLLCTDIICLTETQMQSDHNTEDIQSCLSEFTVEFNCASNHIFNNLAFCFKNSIVVERHIKLPAISIITFHKHTFSFEKITIGILYRQQSFNWETFINTLQVILVENNIDILVGDFNIDAFAVVSPLQENYELVINQSTHLSGSLLDHVYIKKTSLKRKFVNCCTKHIFL